MATVQAGRWDGRRHMFLKEGCTFPKGLVPRVKEPAARGGLPVMKTRDRRATDRRGAGEVEVSDDMLAGITLRPDQLDVVVAALESGCGLLHVARRRQDSHRRRPHQGAAGHAVPVHRPHQAAAEAGARAAGEVLGTIEEHVGVIGDGRFDPKHVTVATMQSLTRHEVTLRSASSRSTQDGRLAVLTRPTTRPRSRSTGSCRRVDAPFRFGLSGTPFGLADGKGLMVEAAFGPVVGA